MCTKEQFLDKAALTKQAVREQLNQKRIKYNWHEADVSVLEGVFARGDRKVADVILKAYEKGCIYDAWGRIFQVSDLGGLLSGVQCRYGLLYDKNAQR